MDYETCRTADSHATLRNEIKNYAMKGTRAAEKGLYMIRLSRLTNMSERYETAQKCGVHCYSVMTDTEIYASFHFRPWYDNFERVLLAGSFGG